MTSALRFRTAAGLGLAVLTVMLLMFAFGGAAFPVTMGNAGVIQMQADTLATKNFALAGAGQSTPEQSGKVAGQATVVGMTAPDGLTMEKSFDLSKALPGAGKWRLKMKMGGPVEGSDLVIGTQKICSAQSTLKTLAVNTQGGPASLNLSAKDGVMNDARLAVVNLSASSLSVQSLNIDLGKGDVDQKLFPGCLADQ